MQVVILCGGQGTRLRDVAEHLPKPMVPVGEKPILWHIMKLYARHGLNRFVLCLGYKSWDVKRYFLDYHLRHGDFSLTLGEPESPTLHDAGGEEDWRITFAETGPEAMTGCRVKRIEKYLADDDHFLLTYGDGLGDVDLSALVEFHLSHGRLGTVTAVRPPGRFGEIELSSGRVTEFNEKPSVSRGRINGGFFVFRREFLDRLDDDPSLVLEQDPLIQLARDGELMAFPHDGFWQPMDTPRDHKFLNELWQSGDAPWARAPAALPRKPR